MSTDVALESIGHGQEIASSPFLAEVIITITDSIYCLLTICKAMCKMSTALFPLQPCEIDNKYSRPLITGKKKKKTMLRR